MLHTCHLENSYKMYKKTSQVPVSCKSDVASFCISLCKAGDGSHQPVLQQGAVIDSSSSVQEVPED